MTWVTRDRRSFGYAIVPGVERDVLVPAAAVSKGALRRGDLVRLELGRDGVGRPFAVSVALLHRERATRRDSRTA